KRDASCLFPIGTIPAKKRFEAVDIVPIQFDQVMSLFLAHFSFVADAILFAVADAAERFDAEEAENLVHHVPRAATEVFELHHPYLLAGKEAEDALYLFKVKPAIKIRVPT